MTHAIDDHNETAPSTAPGPAADLDRIARDLLGSGPRSEHADIARNALHSALDIANGAAVKAAALKDDDTVFPEGRDRLRREAIADAEAEIARRIEQAEAAIAVAHAEAIRAAKPQVSRTEAATARTDARMLLDGAHARGELDQVVAKLAARQDAVGGLVAGSWLGDYLASVGLPDDQARLLRALADEAALDGALASDDTARARAAKRARALANGGSLRKARDAVRSAAFHRLEEQKPGSPHLR